MEALSFNYNRKNIINQKHYIFSFLFSAFEIRVSLGNIEQNFSSIVLKNRIYELTTIPRKCSFKKKLFEYLLKSLQVCFMYV